MLADTYRRYVIYVIANVTGGPVKTLLIACVAQLELCTDACAYARKVQSCQNIMTEACFGKLRQQMRLTHQALNV